MAELKVRELTLNLNECILHNEDKCIDLTSVEFKVLKLLMGAPGRVYTKEQIFEVGWGEDFVVDDNTIRVCISKLRDKVGDKNIKTIRGLGYRIEK